MVSDAVTDLVRAVGVGPYFGYITSYTARHRVMVGFCGMFLRYTDVLAIILRKRSIFLRQGAEL